MMAGNPNWWSMHSEAQQPSYPPPPPPPPPSLCPQHEEDESFSLPPLNSGIANHHNGFFPNSLSQLLMSGLASGEEDKCSMISWIEQHLNPTMMFPVVDDGHNKQEILQSRSKAWLGHGSVVNDDEIQTSHGGGSSNWYGGMTVSSTSPKSCITSTTTTTSNTNTLDFSNNNKEDERDQIHQNHSSDQCDSIDTAGVSKKARVHSSSTAQPTLKVRKEKVGDRVRALHQIVSPFGKTDTASVLTEATGYIRFLHAQIEALSTPYMRNNGSSNFRHQHQGNQERAKDLTSRGLCLVPQSCIAHHAGNDFANGADYWTPSL